MRSKDLVPINIIDAGIPMGVHLVEAGRLLSWRRRKIIGPWKKGSIPTAVLNGLKFDWTEIINGEKNIFH